MRKMKIINDPVYGFINIPTGIIFDLIEHSYFQRLRRIKQLGFTHYVYPGALHTRFHHALGAFHLVTRAIDVLRSKGISISDEEAEAVSIAILLHDIGHGPFSHALESTLINVTHEDLSLAFMEQLNVEFDGALSLAIQVFTGEYPRHFLHQLISSQLDMDRMDYLNRDSFFTGVYEGVIGYDRIIQMLSVKNDELVVEEKGIYSVEKFLIARRLMYWQVYLHKTVLSAEQMLVHTLKRLKYLVGIGETFEVSDSLNFFLHNDFNNTDLQRQKAFLLDKFSKLDDTDIVYVIKKVTENNDFLLSFLSKSIINRKLFKVELKNEKHSTDYLQKIKQQVSKIYGISEEEVSYLVFNGVERNDVYSESSDEIKILFNTGEVVPMSKISEQNVSKKNISKYYLGFPKKNITFARTKFGNGGM